MGQRSVRFPDELEARALAVAVAEDRSFSYVVVRALEGHLSNPAMWGDPSLPAGSQARYESSQAQAWSEVEDRGRVSKPGPLLFKCPVAGCPRRMGSAAAKCPEHGRTVVPE